MDIKGTLYVCWGNNSDLALNYLIIAQTKLLHKMPHLIVMLTHDGLQEGLQAQNNAIHCCNNHYFDGKCNSDEIISKP